MSQEQAKTYLKNERGRGGVGALKDNQDFSLIYYVFQEELRKKFAKILDWTTPDFSLTPKTKIEKWSKRMNNDGTYVLFQMDEEWRPHIIKTPEWKWRRKRWKSGQYWLWDTPEIGWLYSKKSLTPPSI